MGKGLVALALGTAFAASYLLYDSRSSTEFNNLVNIGPAAFNYAYNGSVGQRTHIGANCTADEGFSAGGYGLLGLAGILAGRKLLKK